MHWMRQAGLPREPLYYFRCLTLFDFPVESLGIKMRCFALVFCTKLCLLAPRYAPLLISELLIYPCVKLVGWHAHL